MGGIGLATAVLASFARGSWGTAVVLSHWASGTAPAGWGTGCLVHTVAHHSLAEDENKYLAHTTQINIAVGVESNTHLSWVWSFHSLHTHALRAGPSVTMLGHPLAMGPKWPHALASGLVHSHWRPTNVGCIHAWNHASRQRWRATGSGLIHELAVVCLVWPHLEGGAHLQQRMGSNTSHESAYVVNV